MNFLDNPIFRSKSLETFERQGNNEFGRESPTKSRELGVAYQSSELGVPCSFETVSWPLNLVFRFPK